MATLGSRDAQRATDGAGFTPYAELRETHSAVVFLVGDRAYKLKKPVDLGFLDFSTRAKRRAACERELTLNRRMAPDVYLGISEVYDIDGTVLEHLLTMRRMPAERRLAYLARTGADIGRDLRELAAVIAQFHADAERSPLIAEYGGRAALTRRWEHNFAEIEPYVGSRVDASRYQEVRTLARRYLAGRAHLFEDRIARGAVVDGHGDLLAEDIFCLADGVRILDCIEFDDELRYLDRIDDVACLLMDLERLGSPEMATSFLDTYRRLSGDGAPPSLVHHYIAYRALVRAKVACLPGSADQAAHAPALLDLAHRHLDEGRVRLILIGGAPGAGKTTTAAAVAGALGCAVLSSDPVRKQLAGLAPESSVVTGFGGGLYSPFWTDLTYQELVRRAEHHLGRGESVVVDATWSDATLRQRMSDLADRTSSDLAQFRCVVSAETAEARIAGRVSVSDADAAIAARIRARFADWPEAVCVDTAQPVDAAVAQILHRLQPLQRTVSVPRPRLSPG